MEREWILNPNRLSLEYREGVQSFINFASHYVNERNGIQCPCRNCHNKYVHSVDVVHIHLLNYGMDVTYTRWIHHGEQIDQVNEHASRSFDDEAVNDPNTNMFDMIDDAFNRISDDDEDRMGDPDTFMEEDICADAENYKKLLCEAQKELYPGCSEYTVLTYVVELIHCKVDNHWTNKSVDMALGIMKKMCPKPNNVPQSYYECKKMLKGLGLGYENIHACYYDCALFYKEHEGKENCPVCNEPRYKANVRGQKKVPRKVLRYFPLKPRLQRLFMSRYTAEDMRWHKDKRVDDEGMMRHPADSIAWREFDKMYPDFARDPRNVRLGLATDGFNPFGNMSTSYSMWPVVLFPYNLPPWKCMKREYSLLSLLIPGPKAPGKELDVYLRPLVDELKQLWEHGVRTFDKMSGTSFTMHTALMWTINDFPAYGNISGWSTHGKLACPVCNEDGSYTKLRGKYCFIGHRRFLPKNHSWRKNAQDFNGRREMKDPPREFSGDDILDQFDYLVHCTPGKHPGNKDRKRTRNVEELNWTKKSVLFELEYWHKLKIRHNLDVMHIEKNVCDSVIGTLLNMSNSKDTLKARMDLKDMNIRKALHLTQKDGKYNKPPAEYVFPPPVRRVFLQWLKSIKFPDGYAANMSRNVNVEEGKVSGLKSHDCHVLMQRVLPVGVRKHLKRQICTPLVELASFFQQICAKSLSVSDLDKLEENIILVLCKLEKIFPPAFFDVMVHLVVHLPREAKLAGPVGYRWMYPVERLLGTYKKYVRNKARPEGSIAEAYIAYESLTFCSMYLSDVETEFTRLERNNDGGESDAKLSVFSQKVRPFGSHVMVQFSREEMEVAYWYILDNCEEIEEFRDEHTRLLESESLDNVEQRHRQLFPDWFRRRAMDLYFQEPKLMSEEIFALALGPDLRTVQYTGCVVNGIRYLVNHIDRNRTTQNSGVMTPGSHNGESCNFYGTLVNIIKVQFPRGFKVFLFKCIWYNTNVKGKKAIQDFHLTSVNVNSQWYDSDPYVLAIQAHQVFYIDDLKLGHPWRVVQKIQHRHIWDVPTKTDDDGDGDGDEQNNEDNDDSDADDDTIRSVESRDDETSISLLRDDDVPEFFDANDSTVKNLFEADNNDFINDTSEDEEVLPAGDEESVDSDTYSDYD